MAESKSSTCKCRRPQAWARLILPTWLGSRREQGQWAGSKRLAENSLAILNAGALDELVDINTLNTYNPQLYRYTTGEGTQIEIHVTEGVKKVTDLNGNTLTFGPNGITHSAGKGVIFTRDPDGRITQITDPAGNIRTYAYDANGDLISATDQVGNIARYKYNRSHGLIDIMDPAGNHAARNEYDSVGTTDCYHRCARKSGRVHAQHGRFPGSSARSPGQSNGICLRHGGERRGED